MVLLVGLVVGSIWIIVELVFWFGIVRVMVLIFGIFLMLVFSLLIIFIGLCEEMMLVVMMIGLLNFGLNFCFRML